MSRARVTAFLLTAWLYSSARAADDPASESAPLAVSSRHFGSLTHEQIDDNITEIRFFPDGKRVMACSDASGMLHVWDLQTRERLVKIDPGPVARNLLDFYLVQPDWSGAITIKKDRVLQRTQRDGQQVVYEDNHDAIQFWDLGTGNLLRDYQTDPPRNHRSPKLSPDGKRLFTSDVQSGELGAGPRLSTLTCWDTETGTYSSVAQDVFLYLFSPDSRWAVARINRSDNPRYTGSISTFAVSSWTETRAINIEHNSTVVFPWRFAANGDILVVRVHEYEKPGEFDRFKMTMQFWDFKTGKNLLSVPHPEYQTEFPDLSISPDGLTAVINTVSRTADPCHSIIVNLRDFTYRTVRLPRGQVATHAAFEPSGRCFAVCTYELTPPLPEADIQSQQPRIFVVETTTGRLLETLVAPPGLTPSAAFSPDGKVLATGGLGAVHLWDFCTPPGKLPK